MPTLLFFSEKQMKEREQRQKVADTLSERPIWVRIGLFPFRVRPVTLSQIHDMGAVASEIKDIKIDDLEQYRNMNIMAALIEHYKDADCMRQIAVILLFRSALMRAVFRRYIYRKLRIAHFQKLINYTAKSFDANFFLTSIIFLRRTTAMTGPSQMTARGQSSEE